VPSPKKEKLSTLNEIDQVKGEVGVLRGHSPRGEKPFLLRERIVSPMRNRRGGKGARCSRFDGPEKGLG